MRFALLALSDVDRRAGQANDIAGFIAQRFDMQIIPAHARAVFEGEFRTLRLAARQRFAFQRDHGRAAVGRQDLVIGAAKNGVDRMPKHGIADRGVTQVAILGVDGDLGAAQRRFIARKSGP
jgi:hypothetical protein